MTSQTNGLGRELTAVAMGIDRFERTRAISGGLLDGEGLVPIYLGDDLVAPRTYDGWEAVAADLDALDRAVEATPRDARGVFLRGMMRSLRAAADLFSGKTLTFEDKVRDLVGAPVGRADEGIIAELTERLDQALTTAGFVTGSLRARVEAWESARAVDPAKLEDVFRELMALAKTRTGEMIFDTGDYDMTLNPLRDVHFTARCGFVARRMDLNVDLAFTRAALKHLVCHEVFPGHATQLLYTRAAVERGEAPEDALLVTANAVTGCVQEGIGDQGVQLIDWIEDDDDVIHLTLRSLKSAVQTSAAWRLMAEGEAPESVADYLRTCAFGQEAWVQGRLRMAAHPFRGPFIASYWAGNESVRRVRERSTPKTRDAFHAWLYGHAQSPESLEMFDGGAQ
jgi:hypothetical protein